MSERRSVFVTPRELHDELNSCHVPRPHLLDVRWALGSTNGPALYQAGHIPGAVYVDLESELSGHDRPAEEGRHPLPDLEALQEAARRWGLHDDSRVVVYDQTGGMAAARLWWLLRWAGIRDVRVLDGGYQAWLAANGASNTGTPRPAPGTVTLDGGHLATLDADGAEKLARTGVLIDARAADRYRGESEPVDPRAGHIPGAVNAPTAENLRADSPCGLSFCDEETLRARFAALGIDEDTEVGVYCGSGITAAHEVLALASIGIDAALYPASWSGWCAEEDRPVATGSEP